MHVPMGEGEGWFLVVGWSFLNHWPALMTEMGNRGGAEARRGTNGLLLLPLLFLVPLASHRDGVAL